MMKKLLLSTMCILLGMSVKASYDFCVDGIYYSTKWVDAGEVQVADHPDYPDYGNYPSTLVIPETVIFGNETYKVMSFDGAALSSYPVSSVTIPNSMTVIGADFSESIYLKEIITAGDNPNYSSENGILYNKDKSILLSYPIFKDGTSFTIPATVTTIEERAFMRCYNITSLSIPETVTTIGKNAFTECYNIHTIEIGASVTTVSEDAFNKCRYLANIIIDVDNPNYSSENGILYNKAKTELRIYPYGKAETSFTIPGTVETIGNYAFYENNKLSSVIIPGSVTRIGNYAFTNCALSTIDIPNSVTIIGRQAFRKCDNFTTIVIPNSVTKIGPGAFSSCSNLESVKLPDNLEAIESDLFRGCLQLATVNFPNTIAYIGAGAFQFCMMLTSVKIPASVITIGGSAFAFCENLEEIEIPESTTLLGSSIFYGCEKLTSIIIPRSINTIEEEAFKHCQTLRSLTVNWNDPWEISVHENFFPEKSQCTLRVPNGTKDLYESHSAFSGFMEVVESGISTAVDVSTIQDITVYLSDDILYINTPVSETISVYSSNGLLLNTYEKTAGSASYSLKSNASLIVKGSSGWVKKIGIKL